jgi:hypothetical protein
MTEQCGEEVWQTAPVPGIDVNLDAHSGAQRRQALVAEVDAHADWNALYDLYPVATAILRGQE